MYKHHQHLSHPMANTANQSSLGKRLPNPPLNTNAGRRLDRLGWHLEGNNSRPTSLLHSLKLDLNMVQGCTMFSCGMGYFLWYLHNLTMMTVQAWRSDSNTPPSRNIPQTSDGKGRGGQIVIGSILPLTMCLSFTQLNQKTFTEYLWIP